MKESYLGYWLILLGVFIVAIMLLIRNVTANSSEDYYVLKQVCDSAMIDAIDYAYYRDYGEVKINKEKFMENFLRRFAESVSATSNYKVLFTAIYEAPPKVSVEVTSKTDKYVISSESTDVDIAQRIDSILELGDGKAS